jgi:hypothetical protein
VNKNNNTTIEIKGQLYDAVNGAPVQSVASVQPSIPIPVKQVSSSTIPHHVEATKPITRKHPVNDAQRHTPKTSQILMRSTVKKPALSLKRTLKISASTDNAIDPMPIVQASSLRSLSTQHSKRSQRAALLRQSERISHFVAPQESQVAKPVSPPIAVPQPAPPRTPTDLLLEQALSRAAVHEEPPLAPPKSRWPRVSLVTVPAVVVVLAVLVIGTHSFTNLQLRVASAKAGFSTSLPTYHPAGFTLGQLSYNSGIFASEFSAKNSDQSYTITQRSTAWDTQDLLNNYVMLRDPNYKVVELGTRTVYIYGDGDATWINGGVWYQINSDGLLNDAQIIVVANSL